MLLEHTLSRMQERQLWEAWAQPVGYTLCGAVPTSGLGSGLALMAKQGKVILYQNLTNEVQHSRHRPQKNVLGAFVLIWTSAQGCILQKQETPFPPPGMTLYLWISASLPWAAQGLLTQVTVVSIWGLRETKYGTHCTWKIPQHQTHLHPSTWWEALSCPRQHPNGSQASHLKLSIGIKWDLCFLMCYQQLKIIRFLWSSQSGSEDFWSDLWAPGAAHALDGIQLLLEWSLQLHQAKLHPEQTLFRFLCSSRQSKHQKVKFWAQGIQILQ